MFFCLWFRQEKKWKFKCPLGKREIWHFFETVFLCGLRNQWTFPVGDETEESHAVFMQQTNTFDFYYLFLKSIRLNKIRIKIELIFVCQANLKKSSSWIPRLVVFDCHLILIFCFAKLFENLPNTNKLWISIRVWEKLSFSFFSSFPFHCNPFHRFVIIRSMRYRQLRNQISSLTLSKKTRCCATNTCNEFSPAAMKSRRKSERWRKRN